MYDIGSYIYMKKILKLIPLLAVMLVSLAVPMRGHALDFVGFAGDSDRAVRNIKGISQKTL